LNGIHHILRLGDTLGNKNESKENLVLIELQDKGALDRFDVLQDHYDDEIYKWVRKILIDFIPSIEVRPRFENNGDSDESSGSDEDS